MPHTSPSVQLYSVRDAHAEDLQSAVARVAEIGFTMVEPYSFVEHADEFEQAFSASGVTGPTGHTPVIPPTRRAFPMPPTSSASAQSSTRSSRAVVGKPPTT